MVFISVGRFKVLKFNLLGLEVHNFVITKIRTEIGFGCWNYPLAQKAIKTWIRLLSSFEKV
jgi:hypothetical protein